MISLVLTMVLAGSAAEMKPFDALIAETSASNTPIVVDVFTTWCKPCAAMEREVFPKPVVVAALKTARFVRYDAERGAGIEFAERFGVTGFPTVLVLTPDGMQVGRATSQEAVAFATEIGPMISLASVKGPFTDEAVAKKDTDARVVYIAGLKALRDSPSPAKALALFDQAAARDVDGSKGVKYQAITSAAGLRYREGVTALKVKALLELAQGDPLSGNTLEALGSLSTLSGAFDLAKAKAEGVRIRAAVAASKNSNVLNELIYVQLALTDTDGALATAKALEALNPGPNELDTVAEAYFQANQKEKAIEIEEKIVKASPKDKAFAASLERFKAEEPAPPPYMGRNPLSAFEATGRKVNFYFQELSKIGSTLSDACAGSAGALPATYVRLGFTGTKVSKAVAFDSEAPATLRKCLEAAARKRISTVLAGMPSVDVEVRFPVK